MILWGQSAGSISVDYYNFAYSSDPIVNGLFMESGDSLYPDVNTDAGFSFTNVSDSVGCANLNATTQLECMREVPFNTIKAFMQGPVSSSLVWYPIIDNVTVFSDYAVRAAAGQYSKKVSKVSEKIWLLIAKLTFNTSQLC